ncbi:5800_t:CDS:2 [Cetraspora pellucida]|uniref:5800_t:CDS:1 n=1 Tax=Cetraspora pellucida TaxID=1433469 RepID=A0A9N9P1L0_9GLOM|nr:5800_t:CDS:2 [Cetraspora pellucida]
MQQHQWPSRKINCSWHINLTKPKLSTEVGATNSMMEDIKFYVTKGNIRAKQIYSLLVAKFPDYAILKKNIYNAIKRFKPLLTN